MTYKSYSRGAPLPPIFEAKYVMAKGLVVGGSP